MLQSLEAAMEQRKAGRIGLRTHRINSYQITLDLERIYCTYSAQAIISLSTLYVIVDTGVVRGNAFHAYAKLDLNPHSLLLCLEFVSFFIKPLRSPSIPPS